MLAGWVKTEKIVPGQSTKASVTFAMSELASYDTESSSYILEKGDYIIRYGTGSANIISCATVRLAETITVREVTSSFEGPDFADFKPEVRTGSAGEEKTDATLKVVSVDSKDINTFVWTSDGDFRSVILRVNHIESTGHCGSWLPLGTIAGLGGTNLYHTFCSCE